MSNILRAVKNKVKIASEDNRKAAKNKCAQARNVLDKSFNTEGPQKNKLISQSIELYEESISIYSGLTEPYIAIAYICYQIEKYSEAIKMLNKAIDLDPLNFKAKELLDKIKAEAKEKDISRQVSQAAQKSLSSKLKENKKGSKSVFEMITGIFKTKTVKKNKTSVSKPQISQRVLQPNSQVTKPVTPTGKTEPQKTGQIARHDFHQLLNQARRQARSNDK